MTQTIEITREEKNYVVAIHNNMHFAFWTCEVYEEQGIDSTEFKYCYSVTDGTGNYSYNGSLEGDKLAYRDIAVNRLGKDVAGLIEDVKKGARKNRYPGNGIKWAD